MKRKEITKSVHSKFTNWYIHQPANGPLAEKHGLLQITNERTNKHHHLNRMCNVVTENELDRRP